MRSVVRESSPLPLAVWLARSSVAAVVLFSLTWFVLGIIRPEYSSIREPISGLGVGPNASIMNGAFMLMGVLTAGGAVGMFLLFREMSSSARYGMTGFLLLSSLGGVLCGVFTWKANTPHLIGSSMGLGGPMIGFLAAGIGLRQLSGCQRVGTWILRGAVATTVLAGAFLLIYCFEGSARERRIVGLVERILVLDIHAWYVALAVFATRRVALEERIEPVTKRNVMLTPLPLPLELEGDPVPVQTGSVPPAAPSCEPHATHPSG